MSVARRGLSVAEVLVTAFLLVLLLGGFLAFLFPTLKLVARGTAQTEAQQQGVLALDRIERELRTSATTGVCVYPQSLLAAGEWPGLCLTPLADVDGSGQPNWAVKLVAVWWDRARQRVLIKEWPPKNPPGFTGEPILSRAGRLTIADFKNLITTANGTERSLASGVIDFDVQHAGSSTALVCPLTLRIELSRQEGHHRERFKFRKVFTLRTE